jgi:hypothetical protein
VVDTDTQTNAVEQLLDHISRHRGAIFPPSWDDTVTLISLREPKEINVQALRQFQHNLLQLTGLELMVVGASFGCVKVFVKVTRRRVVKEPGFQQEDIEIDAHYSEGHDQCVLQVIEAIKGSSLLQQQLTEAGFSRVQTSETMMEVRTGKEEPLGRGPQINIFNTINSDVGSIGNDNRLNGISVNQSLENIPSQSKEVKDCGYQSPQESTKTHET